LLGMGGEICAERFFSAYYQQVLRNRPHNGGDYIYPCTTKSKKDLEIRRSLYFFGGHGISAENLLLLVQLVSKPHNSTQRVVDCMCLSKNPDYDKKVGKLFPNHLDNLLKTHPAMHNYLVVDALLLKLIGWSEPKKQLRLDAARRSMLDHVAADPSLRFDMSQLLRRPCVGVYSVLACLDDFYRKQFIQHFEADLVNARKFRP